MVTVAYNAYCVISMEGDDDTYDGKTAGSRSWEVGATVNSLVGTLFHVIITRTVTDLIFLSRLGSTICFTDFGSHDPIVLYWNPWYTEPCYKGSLLYQQQPQDDMLWAQCNKSHRYVCFHWPWSVRWRGADIVCWAAGSWWHCWRHPCVNAACHPTWGELDAWTPPGTYGRTGGYNKIRLNVWDGSKANN